MILMLIMFVISFFENFIITVNSLSHPRSDYLQQRSNYLLKNQIFHQLLNQKAAAP